ncbi:MAG: coenzyme F420-0:L-glutamate ligase [Elusimicrobiaceae bacterium]|nr:coenzyme F420-0:L-glutamate ligase [Elusimicrobiaceae bacterium]
MEITPIKTKLFKQGDDLNKFLFNSLPSLKNGDIICLSSKVAGLAEGRVFNKKEKLKLIKKESSYIKKTALCHFTVRQGLICANAGIDESNAFDKIILLPKNPYKTADILRRTLIKHYKIKNLGVILTDSFILPLRSGVINIAVAYSGFYGVENLVNKKDLCKRPLKMTLVNKADALATAAGFCMGESNNQTPLCLIRGAGVKFIAASRAKEMRYPFKKDFYYPFLKDIF